MGRKVCGGNTKFRNNMKVLVTGATGFVGNYVIEELLKRNIEVVATSRNKEKAKNYAWFKQVNYIDSNLEVSFDTNYYTFFEQPKHLIHLAWEGLPNYTDLFHTEKNLYHNYFFVKNLIENGLKNISITGTCFEYGMMEGCLSETMLTNPKNPYGLAKDTLRKFVEMLNTKHEFSWKWIRLFYMYGEGQNPKSLLAQLEKALQNKEGIFNMSGGEQLRDYLPVADVAKHLVNITLQDKVQGIINCCSGKPISVRNLVEKYLKTNQQSIKLNLGHYPYPTYEPMAFWGDNKKLYEIYTSAR